VKEGDYVQTGTAVMKVMRISGSPTGPPEVIFFIPGQDATRLRKGMTVRLETDKGGIPPEILKGNITFIAAYPASKTAIQTYFTDVDFESQLNMNDAYEARAVLEPFDLKGVADEKETFRSMNGSFCRVVITVARKRPVDYILNRSS